MNKEKMREALEFAREQGLSSITVDGVTFVVPKETKLDVVPDKTVEELMKPGSFLDEMSDEEVLYWSTPYYDELQAMKEMKQKADQEKELNNGN